MLDMVQFGTRKDGRHYPKGSVGNPSKGISVELFNKLRQQNARRLATARAIDNKIKAPIDFEGKHWQQQPNRYDIRGIDDPVSAREYARMKEYVTTKAKAYVKKHSQKVKADWEKLTPKERKDFMADMEKAVKILSNKGTMNLTKTELNKVAAALAFIEIVS